MPAPEAKSVDAAANAASVPPVSSSGNVSFSGLPGCYPVKDFDGSGNARTRRHGLNFWLTLARNTMKYHMIL